MLCIERVFNGFETTVYLYLRWTLRDLWRPPWVCNDWLRCLFWFWQRLCMWRKWFGLVMRRTLETFQRPKIFPSHSVDSLTTKAEIYERRPWQQQPPLDFWKHPIISHHSHQKAKAYRYRSVYVYHHYKYLCNATTDTLVSSASALLHVAASFSFCVPQKLASIISRKPTLSLSRSYLQDETSGFCKTQPCFRAQHPDISMRNVRSHARLSYHTSWESFYHTCVKASTYFPCL